MLALLRILKWSLLAGVAVLCILPLRRLLDRRYRPAWRRRLWMILAAALLLGPVPWGSLLPGLPEEPIQITVPMPVDPESVLPEADLEPLPAAAVSEDAVQPRQPAAPAGETSVSQAKPQAESKPAQQAVLPETVPAPQKPVLRLSPAQLALPIWAAGALCFLFWRLAQTLWLNRQVRRWSRPAPEHMQQLCVALCEDLGMPCPWLIVSPWADTPMVVGCLSPVLVLPDTPVSDRELSFLLLHELSHIRRRDIPAKALLLAANAVHWFNPLVWWMARDAGQIAECLCDEDAVAGGDSADRRAYCEVLLAHAAGRRSVCSGLASAFSGVSALKGRIQNLFAARRRSGRVILTAAVLAVALCACGVGVGGKPVDTPIPTFTVPPATAQPTETPAPAEPTPSPEAAEGLPWSPTNYYTYDQAFVEQYGYVSQYGFDLNGPNCGVYPHGMRDITEGETVYTFPVEDGSLVVRDGGTGELLWEIGAVGDDVILGNSRDWIFLASADGNTLSRMDYHGAREVLYTDTLGLLDLTTFAEFMPTAPYFGMLFFWGSNDTGGLDLCRLHFPDMILDRFAYWPDKLDQAAVETLASQDLLSPILPESTGTFFWTVRNPDCFALYETAEAAGQELTPEAKLQIQQENHTWEYTQYYMDYQTPTRNVLRLLSHEPDGDVSWMDTLQVEPMENNARYTVEASSPEEAAELLAKAYLEDMMAADNRSFLITDYKDLTVSLIPTLEFPESGTLAPTKTETGENKWIAYVDYSFSYRGYISPTGLGDDRWVESLDRAIHRGFLLTQEDENTYTMCSRYKKSLH